MLNRFPAALLLALVVAAGCHRETPPSHVFHHGNIVTVDPQFHIVQAMAIRDGRVVATGTNDDIVKLADSTTAQVDLKGQTVLPGLIDSHVHAPSAAMYEFTQPVPDMNSIEDVLAYYPSARRENRTGQVDHVVASLRHAAARATVSDPRRARPRRAAQPRGLSHRAGRLTEFDGAVDERHRYKVSGADK